MSELPDTQKGKVKKFWNFRYLTYFEHLAHGPQYCLMSQPQSDTLNFGDAFRAAGFFEKLALGFACWFGSGLMPIAPGTWGTLAAVPLVWVLNHFGEFYKGLGLVFLVPMAIWSSGLCERHLGRNDPSEVVVDEVAGFLLTLFLLPLNGLTLSLGFVLFRFFDIAKPFPIRRVEKKVRGGTGVVLDDLLAGFYANLSLRIILVLLGVN